jgi:hypothetical protein
MPDPPGWQLGGPLFEPEEVLVDVDEPKLEALEPAPDAPPSTSVAGVSSSRLVLAPHPRTQTAAVMARIRVWNPAAFIPLPRTIP